MHLRAIYLVGINLAGLVSTTLNDPSHHSSSDVAIRKSLNPQLRRAKSLNSVGSFNSGMVLGKSYPIQRTPSTKMILKSGTDYSTPTADIGSGSSQALPRMDWRKNQVFEDGSSDDYDLPQRIETPEFRSLTSGSLVKTSSHESLKYHLTGNQQQLMRAASHDESEEEIQQMPQKVTSGLLQHPKMQSNNQDALHGSFHTLDSDMQSGLRLQPHRFREPPTVRERVSRFGKQLAGVLGSSKRQGNAQGSRDRPTEIALAQVRRDLSRPERTHQIQPYLPARGNFKKKIQAGVSLLSKKAKATYIKFLEKIQEYIPAFVVISIILGVEALPKIISILPPSEDFKDNIHSWLAHTQLRSWLDSIPLEGPASVFLSSNDNTPHPNNAPSDGRVIRRLLESSSLNPPKQRSPFGETDEDLLFEGRDYGYVPCTPALRAKNGQIEQRIVVYDKPTLKKMSPRQRRGLIDIMNMWRRATIQDEAGHRKLLSKGGDLRRTRSTSDKPTTDLRAPVGDHAKFGLLMGKQAQMHSRSHSSKP